MLNIVDLDGNGCIDFAEFVELVLNSLELERKGHRPGRGVTMASKDMMLAFGGAEAEEVYRADQQARAGHGQDAMKSGVVGQPIIAEVIPGHVQ